MSDVKLFVDSDIVHIRSVLFNRADQGNIPGEVGIFAFGLQDNSAVSRALTARKPVQIGIDGGLRMDITITRIDKSYSQSGTEFVAHFHVNRYSE